MPQDDPEQRPRSGTDEGLEEADGGVTLENGKVTAADGYTVLDIQQIGAAARRLDEIAIPTEDGNFIVRVGTSEAFEGSAHAGVRRGRRHASPTPTTDTVYTVQQDGDREFFVDENGERISDQSWTANVGFDNYNKIFTDPTIRSGFFRIFIWNVRLRHGVGGRRRSCSGCSSPSPSTTPGCAGRRSTARC